MAAGPRRPSRGDSSPQASRAEESQGRKLARHRLFQRRLVSLEPQFVPLLCSVLLPVALLPVSADPSGRYRWLLPLLLTFLVGQSLRALPALSPGRLSQLLLALQRLLGFGATSGLWFLAFWGRRGVPTMALRFTVLLFTGLFSLLASLKLVVLLARVPRVNARVMAGAAAGYVYLGLTGGLVASALQVLVPGSFALGMEGRHEFLIDRLTYFSFVVLAGLGMGDVLPSNPLGERFVILLSLAGTLYLALLLGLLIGRYIATQELELEFDALADEVEDPGSPIGGRLAGERQDGGVRSGEH